MKIDLSTDEIQFLERLTSDHLAYYKLLSAQAICSSENRARYLFVRDLASKLAAEVERSYSKTLTRIES